MASKTTAKKSTSKKPATVTERAVLVTTERRGVFFGYATGDTSGKDLVLLRARNCIQWRGIRGFLALACVGPGAQCRIGPAVPRLDVRGVTPGLAASGGKERETMTKLGRKVKAMWRRTRKRGEGLREWARRTESETVRAWLRRKEGKVSNGSA